MTNKIEYYAKIKEIDEILDCKKDKDTLFTFIKKPGLDNYFFRKVSTLDWFLKLKDKSFFDPKRVPSPKPAEKKGAYLIPEWNPLPYLEKISKQVSIPENEKYISELLEIIKTVSNYKDQRGKHIDNYRTWWYFVKILLNIPNDKIPIDIIDLIPIWLDSKFDTFLQGTEIVTRLLPKFLNENSTDDDVKKAEKIIKYSTDIKTAKVSKKDEKLFRKKEEYSFKIDRYWIEKIIRKNTKLIAKKCSLQVIEDLVNKIEKMLEKHEDGTYRSFYTDDQIYEPIDLFTNLLKNILDKKANEKPEEIKALLEKFIGHEFYYFQKMALYIIGKHIDGFKDLIWKYIVEIIGNSVRRNYYIGDELKHLLQNLGKLSPEQKQNLKSIIEKGPTKDIPDEEATKYKLRWKQELSHALKHEPTFEQLYKEFKEKTQEEAYLSPGIIETKMKWGSGPSPLREEDILKKSNMKLAKIFKEFRDENLWDGPTINGLSDMLKKAVRDNPDKFIEDLMPFLNTGYQYIYDLLWGIRDAWKDKKEIDWEKILVFIHKYIDRKDFWDDKFTVEGSHSSADHNWILGFVGELIQEGTKDDRWAFKAELLPKAQGILFLTITEIIRKPIKKEKESDDPVSYALNSPTGKIITALILLELRKARVENKDIKEGGSRWTVEIRDIYDELLQNNIDEAFTLLGQYMPNFMYLDKAWMREKIKEQEKNKDPYWSSFMSGYFYGGKVFFDIFKMMKPHYKRAIKSEFKDKIAEEALIQHIAIGYLNDLVEIDKESLLDKIIEKSNPKQIDTLVSYFRNLWRGLLDAEGKSKEKMDEVTKNREKIINYWRFLYQKYKKKSKLSDDDREILSNLLDLTISLPNLNDEYYEWIVFSFSESKHKRYYEPVHLIEDLLVLKDKGKHPESGRFVGKIFLEILKRTTPRAFKGNIKKIVEYLYDVRDKEAKEFADEICNAYAEQGVYDEKTSQLFLRDVYEKHNQ